MRHRRARARYVRNALKRKRETSLLHFYCDYCAQRGRFRVYEDGAPSGQSCYPHVLIMLRDGAAVAAGNSRFAGRLEVRPFKYVIPHSART